MTNDPTILIIAEAFCMAVLGVGLATMIATAVRIWVDIPSRNPDVYWVEYENGAIAVWLGFMWRSSLQGIEYMHLPSVVYIPGYGWIRRYADMWSDGHIPQVMESKGFDYGDASLNWPLIQSYVESNLRTMRKTISAYVIVGGEETFTNRLSSSGYIHTQLIRKGGKIKKVKYRP